MRAPLRRIAVLLACWATLLGAPVVHGAAATASPAAASVPVYAYFYQWFEKSSWSRAKFDHPLAGDYSSDDPHVLRDQIQSARGAGINGFLTSWKRTPQLDRRLDLLLTMASSENFDIGVVYEALDFARKPLPIATVRSDLVYLRNHYGRELRSAYFGKPVIVWTGTDQYSTADIRSVRAALGPRVDLLASSKSVDDYNRVAADVDGEAYYWSSANPRSSSTLPKLNQMAAAVHRHRGIWIAPAASGFDGRALGHSRVIARDGGSTFELSLHNAYASRPDAVGVISWNEWSENTYIEAGHRYGAEELHVLQNYLLALKDPNAPPRGSAAPPPKQSSRGWTGSRATVALAAVSFVGLLLLLTLPYRQRRRPAHARVDDERQLSDTRT